VIRLWLGFRDSMPDPVPSLLCSLFADSAELRFFIAERMVEGRALVDQLPGDNAPLLVVASSASRILRKEGRLGGLWGHLEAVRRERRDEIRRVWAEVSRESEPPAVGGRCRFRGLLLCTLGVAAVAMILAIRDHLDGDSAALDDSDEFRAPWGSDLPRWQPWADPGESPENEAEGSGGVRPQGGQRASGTTSGRLKRAQSFVGTGASAVAVVAAIPMTHERMVVERICGGREDLRSCNRGSPSEYRLVTRERAGCHVVEVKPRCRVLTTSRAVECESELVGDEHGPEFTIRARESREHSIELVTRWQCTS